MQHLEYAWMTWNPLSKTIESTPIIRALLTYVTSGSWSWLHCLKIWHRFWGQQTLHEKARKLGQQSKHGETPNKVQSECWRRGSPTNAAIGTTGLLLFPPNHELWWADFWLHFPWRILLSPNGCIPPLVVTILSTVVFQKVSTWSVLHSCCLFWPCPCGPKAWLLQKMTQHWLGDSLTHLLVHVLH